jgi:hypothetical protein
MTNQHPITPPPELIKQWVSAFYNTPIVPGEFSIDIATKAAQWGADSELEACCKCIPKRTSWDAERLYAARRPKPPSLKEQALEALEALPTPAGQVTADRLDTIRRALEALND